MLANYLEQTVLYNNINFGYGFCYPGYGVNTTIQRASIAVLQCPSDGTNRLTNAEGHTNYAYCGGNIPANFNDVRSYSAFNGVFGQIGRVGSNICGTSGLGGSSPCVSDGALNIAAITDGTSNTAAFSERVKGIGTTNNGQVDFP